MSNMTLTTVTRICWFILLLHLTLSYAESKTSSECWACNPNTPHVLSCTGSSVIVIHSASYGYKAGCSGGITGGGCSGAEINRCCKPGGPSINCLESFNETDRGELERTCSSKSTCTFNSIEHLQPYTCGGLTFPNNSFTLINYTCQTSANITSPTTADAPSTQESGHITTTVSSDQRSEDGDGDNDGDGGTTAAIVICVLLVIVGVALVLFFFIRKKNRQKDKHKTTTPKKETDKTTEMTTTNTTSPIYHIVASDASLPRNLSYEMAGDVMSSRNQSQKGFHAGSSDTYQQIEDSDLIQNKPHDGYTTVGITNTALGDDDYHHFVEGNSNKIVTGGDTYNHVTHAGTQLDKDDYLHIDVDTTKETINTEYNHVGPDGGTDTYGYNRFGVIKPEVNDNENYNHIGNV